MVIQTYMEWISFKIVGIVVWQLANLVETPEILAQSPLRLYDYNFISLFIYLFFLHLLLNFTVVHLIMFFFSIRQEINQLWEHS